MTTVKGQLLLMLETVANALGDDLRKRLVFVGGCTTALFITDEVVLESVRATDDVDLIVDLVGRAQWAQRVAGMDHPPDVAALIRATLARQFSGLRR